MAQITLNPQYTLTLSAADLRLICLALDGRIRFGAPGEEGKDATEARKLGNALFTTRNKMLQDYAKSHSAPERTDEES